MVFFYVILMALYLHKLLSDLLLEYKLNLKNGKNSIRILVSLLFRFIFFPDECDWAQLSLISNGTGFSRVTFSFI